MGHKIEFDYNDGRGHMMVDLDNMILDMPLVKQKKMAKIIKSNASDEELHIIVEMCKEESEENALSSAAYQSEADDVLDRMNDYIDKKSEQYKSLRKKYAYRIDMAKKREKEAEKYNRFRKILEEAVV